MKKPKIYIVNWKPFAINCNLCLAVGYRRKYFFIHAYQPTRTCLTVPVIITDVRETRCRLSMYVGRWYDRQSAVLHGYKYANTFSSALVYFSYCVVAGVVVLVFWFKKITWVLIFCSKLNVWWHSVVSLNSVGVCVKFIFYFSYFLLLSRVFEYDTQLNKINKQIFSQALWIEEKNDR